MILSENFKNVVRRPSRHLEVRRSWSSSLAGLSLAAVLSVGVVVTRSPTTWAGPENIQVDRVVAGSASFQHNGPDTTIRAADRTIINYQRFDIPVQNSVTFVQPTATSRVLNRVQSAVPSRIDGSLSANGILYFVNPAGVIFGPDSILNVGQIYAGAANITNDDFLNNVNRFTTDTGAVVNYGQINAREAVHLIGRHVANHGAIVVPEGAVTLAAGDEIFLGERNGHVLVKVNTGDVTGGSGVAGTAENDGSISASSTRTAFAVGDMYSLAILNSGSVQAKDIAVQGGSGDVQVSGSLDASRTDPGETGGTVEVLGGRVAVIDARIDASGDAGGGRVLIGGDLGGGGDAPRASHTYVSPGAEIRADAGTSGDGGEVIVWADEVTRYFGSISAQGGEEAGDGGFAEVSGREDLEFYGSVDLTSPAGETGTLLLDPNNITIQAAGPDTNISGAGTTVDPFTTLDDGAILTTGAIETALGMAAVRVVTGSAGADNEDGDIFIDDPIDGSGLNNDLTLEAHRNITLSAGIDFSGSSGNLALRADFVNPDGIGAIVDGGGSITMGTGDLLLTAGSGIGAPADPIETVGLTDVAGSTATGGIFLNNTGSGAPNITLVGATPGLSTTTDGDISLTTSTNAITASDVVSAMGAGTVTLSAPDGVAVNANITTAGGAVTIDADSDAGDLLGALTIANGVAVTSNGGAVSVTADDVDFAGTGAVNAGAGDVAYVPSTALTIGVGGGAGDFNIEDAVVTQTATTGTLAIGDPAALDITLDAVNAGSRNVKLVTGGGIDDGMATSLQVDASGSIHLDAAGAIGGGATLDIDTTRLTIETETSFDITSASELVELSVITDGTVGPQALTDGTLVYNVAEVASDTTIVQVDGTGGVASDLAFSYQNTAGNITATLVNTAGGDLTVAASNGAVTLVDVDTTAGNVDVSAAGDITVADGGVTTTGGTVNIDSANGAILTASGDEENNLPEVVTDNASITLEANAGIHDTDSGTASFEIDSGGGAVNLRRDGTGLVSVDYVSGAGPDAVGLTVLDTGTGDLSFESDATGILTLGAITLPDGALTVAGGGTISVTGAIDTSGGTGGDIRLTAANTANILLQNVDPGPLLDAGAGNVNLTVSGGTIQVLDPDVDDDVEISSGGTVTLTANGVGAGNRLDIEGATALEITDTGGLFAHILIDEVSGSTIASTTITVADSSSGDIDIDYFPAGGNVVAIANNTINNVDLSNATQSSFSYLAQAGDITVAGPVDSGARPATITAAGGSLTVNAQISGDPVTLTGAGALTINAGVTNPNGNQITLTSDSDNAGGGDFDQTAGAIRSTGGTIAINAGTTAASAASATVSNVDAGGAGSVTITALGGSVDENGAGDAGADIAANLLTIDAADGVGGTRDIETSVALLDVDNTTAGDIALNDLGDVQVNNLDQAGPGALTLTAGGRITVAGTGVTSSGGDVLLDADGDELIDVNVAIRSSGGGITLDAEGSVDVGADVNSTDSLGAGIAGDILIRADSDGDSGTDSVVHSGGVITTDDTTTDGDITLRSGDDAAGGSGNISVGTIDAGSGNLTILVNGGFIVEQGGASNLTANTLTLASGGAAGGVGAAGAGAIDGVVSTIAGQSGSGGFFYDNGGNALAVGDSPLLDFTDLGGDATEVISGIASGGTLELLAGSLAVNSALSGDPVTLAIPSTLSVNADITSPGGTVTLTSDSDNAGGGNFDQTAGAIRSIGGTIAINAGTAAGSTASATVSNVDAGAMGMVTISALGGSVNENGAGDAGADVAASLLTIDAADGVGGIETSVAFLDVDNASTGDIVIADLGGLQVNNLNQAGPGAVTLTSTGAITVAASGVRATTGQVDLSAATDLNVNAAVMTTSADINLLADDDLAFSASGAVSAGGASDVVVMADADGGASGTSGGITMGNGALIDAGSGTIALSADEDIALGGLLTTNALATAVTLRTTSGGIVDGGDAHVDVSAASGRLEIDAAGGVGSAGAIDTAVASVDVVNAASGNIDINETDGVSIIQLDQNAASGNVNLDAGGTIVVEQAGSGVTAVGGQVELDANGAGSNILVNRAIGTGGSINLFAGGAINGAARIAAPTVDLDAGTGIGDSTPLELAASAITADSSSDSIDIDNSLATDVMVSSLTTSGGNILFDQENGGKVTFDTVSTGSGGDIGLTNVGGDLELLSSVTNTGSQSYDAMGDLILNSTYQATGDISLNPNIARALADATAATIYKTDDPGVVGDLEFISTGGSFIMNLNDKITVTQGSLTIRAAVEAVLTDISVRDDLTVEAPTIVLLRRDSGDVETLTGTTIFDSIQEPIQGPVGVTTVPERRDGIRTGIDIIAGQQIRFVNAQDVVVDGASGPEPRFADRDGPGIKQPSGGIDPDGVPGLLTVLQGGTISLEFLKLARPLVHGGGPASAHPDLAGVQDFGTGTPLDLSLATVRNVVPSVNTDQFGRPISTETNLAPSIAGFLPQVRQDVTQESTIAAASAEALATIGIIARDLSAEEFLGQLIGVLYEDLPPEPERIQELPVGQLEVAKSRLPRELVDRVFNIITNLFWENFADKERRKSKASQIGQTFEKAKGDYLDQLEDEAQESPEDFRRFLFAKESQYGQACSYLRQLKELLVTLDLLGLTALEYEQAESLAVGAVTSPLVEFQELLEVIKGSPAAGESAKEPVSEEPVSEEPVSEEPVSEEPVSEGSEETSS